MENNHQIKIFIALGLVMLLSQFNLVNAQSANDYNITPEATTYKTTPDADASTTLDSSINMQQHLNWNYSVGSVLSATEIEAAEKKTPPSLSGRTSWRELEVQ